MQGHTVVLFIGPVCLNEAGTNFSLSIRTFLHPHKLYFPIFTLGKRKSSQMDPIRSSSSSVLLQHPVFSGLNPTDTYSPKGLYTHALNAV